MTSHLTLQHFLQAPSCVCDVLVTIIVVIWFNSWFLVRLLNYGTGLEHRLANLVAPTMQEQSKNNSKTLGLSIRDALMHQCIIDVDRYCARLTGISALANNVSWCQFILLFFCCINSVLASEYIQQLIQSIKFLLDKRSHKHWLALGITVWGYNTVS